MTKANIVLGAVIVGLLLFQLKDRVSARGSNTTICDAGYHRNIPTNDGIMQALNEMNDRLLTELDSIEYRILAMENSRETLAIDNTDDAATSLLANAEPVIPDQATSDYLGVALAEDIIARGTLSTMNLMALQSQLTQLSPSERNQVFKRISVAVNNQQLEFISDHAR